MNTLRYILMVDTRGHLYVRVDEPGTDAQPGHVQVSRHHSIDAAFDAKDVLQADIDRISRRHCATCE